MKVVYVAGPYSADTEYGVKLNIAKAEAAAIKIWQTGSAAAICPHLNTAHWGGILTHQEFIQGDLEIINRCDAVLMLDGWKSSKGAVQEFKHAKFTGRLVFEDIACLMLWLLDETWNGGAA